MNDNHPGYSRRQFLTQVVATAAGAMVAGGLGHATNLLAANDPPAPRELLPNFVSGEVAAVGPDYVDIFAAGYATVRVFIGEASDICNGDCGESLSSISVGDRAESSTYASLNHPRVARWLNVNLVAGWGTVRSVDGAVLTVAPMDNKSDPVRQVTVYPYTRVSGDGVSELGAIGLLKLGDMIHYTGHTPSSDYSDRSVMGAHIHLILPPST